jgi:hypothetical protein
VISLIIFNILEVLEISGVGKIIKINNNVSGMIAENETDKITPDKSATASDK